METPNKAITKTFGMSAIMKNKKLAKLVDEALSSSPGSTKRKQALSMIKSLNKTADGRGGGPAILSDIPAALQQIGQTGEQALKGTQDIGTQAGLTGVHYGEQAARGVGNIATPMFGGEQIPLSEPTWAEKQMKRIIPSAPVASAKTKEETAAPSVPQPGVSAPEAEAKKTGVEYTPPTSLPSIPQAPVSRYYPSDVSVAESVGYDISPEELSSLTETVTSATGDIEKAPVEEGTPQAEELTTLSKSGYFDNWYNNLSASDKKHYKPLYEAVKAGVGAPTFAAKVLADKNKLKKLMPNVPEENLPVGATLSGQIDDIDEALRKEYQVDTLKNNVERLEERDLTLEGDLQDYIKARDEYLVQVDSMIDKTKDSMLNMDMANPYISKTMGNYMDYLYLLKSRQQQRYSDYVDTSIEQHNARLTRAQNDYDSAYDKYERALESETSITTETYNTMKDMLEDMYTNLDTRQEESYNLGILGEDYIQSQLETANSLEQRAEGYFKEVGPTVVNETTEFLNQYLTDVDDEGNKYVTPEKYGEKKEEWKSKYGAGKFEENFAPQDWLNPNNPENDKYFLTEYQYYQTKTEEGEGSNEDLSKKKW